MTHVFTYFSDTRFFIVEITPVDSLSYKVILTEMETLPGTVGFETYGQVTDKYEREYTRGDGDVYRIARDMIRHCTTIEVS